MKKWKNSEIHEESKMGNAHEQMTKPSIEGYNISSYINNSISVNSNRVVVATVVIVVVVTMYAVGVWVRMYTPVSLGQCTSTIMTLVSPIKEIFKFEACIRISHETVIKISNVNGTDLRSTKAVSRSKGNPSEITAREPLKLEFGRNSVRFGFENVGNERNRDEIKSAPLKFNEFSFVQHSFIITEDDRTCLTQSSPKSRYALHLTLTYHVYTAGNNCQQGGTIC
ncbi:hypothetical protein GQX74_007411 [Glossina fuscipes]|nr:hypothetical protein GQX74_007411 [Glossina fuscipes]